MEYIRRSSIEIFVNGDIIHPGQYCPEVKSLVVNVYGRVLIPKHQKLKVIQWMLDIVKRCESEYIEYNGVLILKSEVEEYKI